MILWIAIICFMTVVGFLFGRLIGMIQGRALGSTGAVIELYVRAHETGQCPLCREYCGGYNLGNFSRTKGLV